MSNDKLCQDHTRGYVIVFIVLVLLTIVELFIPDLSGISRFFKGIILTLLAVGKAYIVGYYFMHLKDETAWIKAFALLPAVIIIFTAVILLDAHYR